MEEVEGVEETTQFQGEEGVEVLNDPRPDMELLGNDCNQQPFTFCDLLPCDGTAGDNSRCRLSTYL